MKKPRDIPRFKSASWDKFRDYINTKGQEITSAPPDANVDTLWCSIRDALVEGTQKFIPHKRTREKIDLPYITPTLRRLIHRRDRLHDKMRKQRRNISNHDRAAATKTKYKHLKAHVQSEIRLVIHRAGHLTPWRQRKNIKIILVPCERNWTEKMGIASLKSPDTGEQVGDAVGKATIHNKQFQQAFTSETPLSDDHSKPQTHPDIPDITFTVNGIQRLLAGLDPNKASGPDKVLPRVLKELASPLAPILSDLFNRSFQTGSVPMDWRHANVSPVYKKGKKILAVNYRPISLTCVCCKVFEHIVASALMSHAQRDNLLYSLQHGFRSKLSCETQLVEFVRDLAENMYAGHQTDVLVMDFSKAFDKVGHRRLLTKLQGYGVTGKMSSWIQNWLADRTQVVVVDGEQSGPVPVTSGVPQGSAWPWPSCRVGEDLADGIPSRQVPGTTGHQQRPPKHHPTWLHSTRTYAERCWWCQVPWPDSIEQPQMGHTNCKSFSQGQLHHGSTEEECSGVL